MFVCVFVVGRVGGYLVTICICICSLGFALLQKHIGVKNDLGKVFI